MAPSSLEPPQSPFPMFTNPNEMFLYHLTNNTSSTVEHSNDHSLANFGTKCLPGSITALSAIQDCLLTITSSSQTSGMRPSGEPSTELLPLLTSRSSSMRLMLLGQETNQITLSTNDASAPSATAIWEQSSWTALLRPSSDTPSTHPCSSSTNSLISPTHTSVANVSETIGPQTTR